MNAVLYYVFFVGFVYLPLAVLFLRAKWPQRMPWVLAFPIVAVVGWACLIGLAFSDDISEGEAAASNGFVAVLFGWAYSLIWFIPWLCGYGILQNFRSSKRSDYDASCPPSPSSVQSEPSGTPSRKEDDSMRSLRQ